LEDSENRVTVRASSRPAGTGQESFVAGLRETMTGSETADEAAIKEVCLKETWGHHYGDPDLWASAWLHRDDCSLIGIFWDTGLFARIGWADIEAAIRPFAEAKAAGTSEVILTRHSGHRIKVIGDMACATFTETLWDFSDAGRNTPMDLFELRILERHDGCWKITHLIFIPLRNIAHDRAQIRVDATGRVSHISPEMKAAMADSGLTISAGRLRAVRPQPDRELQAVIRRMHGLTGFGELGMAFLKGEFLGRVHPWEFPILLGEDERGGQRYCLVMVQDGEVFVALDTPARLGRRLQLANIVYGLSEAQLRLAREIVGGLTLPEAAEKLGISPNTARTHLTRIFEKTGVSNQAALVRCLLTVGT
jgi:DNA-binding CsgD family transcriptional regulator